MKKVRISCDVNLKLRQQIDTRSKENGISRAKFIEIAIEDKVEGFNVHKENKRLTEARRKTEQEINALQQKNTTLEKQVAEEKKVCERLEQEKAQLTVKHTDRIKEIAAVLGVPGTIGHIKQRIGELRTTQERLEQEKTERTEQRDEFERLLHAETDAYNKCYARAESQKKERDTFKENLKQIASHLGVPDTVAHCKQRIDELQASIETKKRERDRFKAQAEEVKSKLNVCDEKLRQLQGRNWWERLWNTLPWL